MAMRRSGFLSRLNAKSSKGAVRKPEMARATGSMCVLSAQFLAGKMQFVPGKMRVNLKASRGMRWIRSTE